jgi:hypothetical protein
MSLGVLTHSRRSNAYGRRVSGAMESRAAVFTSSPQTVEVFQAGTWWRGELLGWRHDASGTCRMWVRMVTGGVEETAWVDLAALRLPELPVAAVAVPALRGGGTTTDAATTAALPMIRDEVPAPVLPVPALIAAAPTVSVTLPGGRRRAPEDTDIRVAVAADVSVPPGRHRAPRDDGRHRAADTEIFAAIADESGRGSGESAAAGESRRAARPHAGAAWSVPQARTPRPEESYGRSEVCAGPVDAEPDLLTRPMRLGDLSPNPRRPRVGNSLFGA